MPIWFQLAIIQPEGLLSYVYSLLFANSYEKFEKLILENSIIFLDLVQTY